MIGWNPQKINDLLQELADSYTKIGTTISDGWPTVQTTMEQYWVGPDEENYERAFCKRMNQLYVDAYQTVNWLKTTLFQLADDWHQYQLQNVLEGSGGANDVVSIENPEITLNDKLIQEKKFEAGAGVARGIKDGAYSAIQSSMSTYLSDIKSSLQNLYSGIDSSTAFLGAKQSQAINQTIETIGNSIASVVTAANDIYTAVQTLAGTNYEASEETVSSEMSSATSNYQSNVESTLGDMKWNG